MRITVQDRREEALKAGFASLLDRLEHGYSFESFCGILNDWEVKAFCDGERTIGMLMVKGPELHVAVLPEVRGKWLSRRLIREVFNPIFKTYGKAETDVSPDNEKGIEFVNRIREGFASGRFDPVSVLTSVGGSLLSGALQGGASEQAAGQAAGASNNATNAQLSMFNTQNQQQAPYRTAGYQGLGLLGNYLGTGPQGGDLSSPFAGNATLKQLYDNALTQGQSPEQAAAGINAYAGTNYPTTGTGGANYGSLLHQFNASDLNSNLAPNYEFVKQQGIGATTNQLNASGGALGGNALKGVTDYATNLAGNAYQNAFQNYTANQTNIFNRLSSLAGLGQTANAATSQLAGSIAPGVASSMIGAGQAQAAGTVGAANAFSGGANNALGWYQLGNFMNSGGGGATVMSGGGGSPIGAGDFGAS